jgi:hypothetical protein
MTKEEKKLRDTIRNMEHKIRYSDNPLEQRQLRMQVGKLQRELKILENKKVQ